MKKLTLAGLLQSIEEDSSVRSLIQSSPVCHKIFDPDFKLRFMSRSGVAALHIENIEDFYGKTFPTDSAPKITRDIFNENIRLAAKGETKTFEYSFEVDGNVIWYRTTLSPFFDNDGILIYIKADSMEITDRKKAEMLLKEANENLETRVDERTKELRETNIKLNEEVHERKLTESRLIQYQKALESLNEKAEAANKAKSLFLSHMSHEVRTPLNGLLGYVQRLKMNGSFNSDQEKAMQAIEASGIHLLELINGILDISIIEAGRKEINLADFSLTGMIEGLSIMFKDRCESKGLKFIVTGLDQKPIYVHGDEGNLRQVLINLLGNAVKFTDKGEVNLLIEKGKGENYVFKIKDTGVGISSNDKIKIFQSFVQADAGMEFGGTGLGLAISKELVELMGGKLLVESQLGEGSCFSVLLELPQAKSTFRQQIDSHEGDIRLSKNCHVKALVVEDNTLNRELLSDSLREAGIETQEVENGQNALKRLSEFEPDIIFMDRLMPILNGDETVKAIVSKYGPDPFKIVAVTASAFEHQRENYKLLGYDDYIVKPFCIPDVFKCIKTLLNVEFEYEDENR